MVLFERATFLVIAHATERQHDDVHRFEKISNIVKQFKLSVSKTSHEFEGMMVGVVFVCVFVGNDDRRRVSSRVDVSCRGRFHAKLSPWRVSRVICVGTGASKRGSSFITVLSPFRWVCGKTSSTVASAVKPAVK